MDIPTLFTKSHRILPFGIAYYHLDNPYYLDPKKTIMLRELEAANKRSQGKFKPPKKRKPCFADEGVKPYKYIPGVGAYKIERSMTAPLLTKLKSKVDLKVQKNTYIDQLVREEEKRKKPGIGKYNITKSLEDIEKENKKKYSRKIVQGYKLNNLDDFKFLSDQVPGVGQYNLTERKKYKKDMKDYKFYIAKHAEEEERTRAKSARPDPMSYEPIPAAFNTFRSIQRDVKYKNMSSRWYHGSIDKRPSSTGFLVSPGPAQHTLINKWVKDSKSEKDNLNVKLLDRLSKGYKPGVYH